jgi:hypothetical protein
MTKGLTNSITFVRRKADLEGRDLDRAKMYLRGYAILTTNDEGEAVYVHILSNSTTFSDNLTRQIAGTKYERGTEVVDYTREEDDKSNGQSAKQKKKAKVKA